MDERASVHLIEALSRVWSKIRALHPGVPGVVLLPTPASGRMNVLGHFAALRWNGVTQGASRLHEVVVVAEHLDRPAEAIAETLLHEAAHALNFERRIHDCSASQYHNKHFRQAAEKLGLSVQQVPHYGHALTTLPDSTSKVYADEIEALRQVLIHRSRSTGTTPTGPTPTGDDDSEPDDKPASRSRKATCSCSPPYIIRVSRSTISETTIRCDSCGEAFRLDGH